MQTSNRLPKHVRMLKLVGGVTGILKLKIVISQYRVYKASSWFRPPNQRNIVSTVYTISDNRIASKFREAHVCFQFCVYLSRWGICEAAFCRAVRTLVPAVCMYVCCKTPCLQHRYAQIHCWP